MVGEDTNDEVGLRWIMDAERPGVDADPLNPLMRSVRRLADTGKPFSRLALAVFSEGGRKCRWFGVFVQGRRTVFFPGFASKFDEIESHRFDEKVLRRAFSFDHVSLEHDRKKWHVTASASHDHLGNARTLDLGEGRVLWFGLSFDAIEVFRPVFNETVADFTSPKGQGDRRRKIFSAAREGVGFPAMSWNEVDLNAGGEQLLHVSVIAGPQGFADYVGPEHALPVGSPYVRDSLANTAIDLPIKLYRIHFTDHTDIQITLMRVPGALLVPATFTGASEPMSSSFEVK